MCQRLYARENDRNITEEVNKMGKCELCSKEGSRMEANHKELGRIMVCQDCWVNLYDKNRMTCSVDASGGSCSCCSCR
uniref:Uncharacterized protein n=1 Tax=Candidatus Methanophaga sp. ANME-1 ERB7 TaxID=2759913 RepID=A0A7G9Z2P8_9EURY|nr:hypothetical protein BGNFGLGO_00003 [Methanosarcinales archaeon ANME-1 ERB7]